MPAQRPEPKPVHPLLRPAPIALMLWLGLPWPNASSAADTAAPQRLDGAAAWGALLGNTVSGHTPDGPYSDYYAPGGEVFHADRDGTDRGRWVLRGPMVCLIFPEDDADDCRTPEVLGQHGAFIDRDGSRYPFDIETGNAKHF